MESTNIQDNKLPPTLKEFLEDSYKFELCDAILIQRESFQKEENFYGLIFDRTIFHPQGGGQPSDEGEIENQVSKKVIKIEGLIYDRMRDIIIHKVSKSNADENNLEPGNKFDMKINKERRMINARLHSGGHLLDIAVSKLGINIIPSKGYHFEDGPYVEYTGTIDKSGINEIREQIEKVSNELLQQSKLEDASIVKVYPYSEAKQVLQLPSYLPEDKPVRWVKLTRDDLGCPCGGTHVKHIKDIEAMKITKITNKSKIVRISYNILSKII